ncbi:MAG: NUDIX domain-containing protein [Chlorobi bacterium]|nr:NUDIX domain-containing protein [Chlorobiota bacterium]
MEITFFLEDRKLILTDRLREGFPLYVYAHTVIPLLLTKIRKEDLSTVYLYHPDPARALEDFKKYFDVIEAAGGIVFHPDGRILFIYRRGIWDLPKGKMEPGETPEETALREIKEECGLENLRPRRYFTRTYHLFKEQGRRKMKITHWYLMDAPPDAAPAPQGREGIEKTEWLPPHYPELYEPGKVYGSVKSLLEKLEFIRPSGGGASHTPPTGG